MRAKCKTCSLKERPNNRLKIENRRLMDTNDQVIKLSKPHQSLPFYTCAGIGNVLDLLFNSDVTPVSIVIIDPDPVMCAVWRSFIEQLKVEDATFEAALKKTCQTFDYHLFIDGGRINSDVQYYEEFFNELNEKRQKFIFDKLSSIAVFESTFQQAVDQIPDRSIVNMSNILELFFEHPGCYSSEWKGMFQFLHQITSKQVWVVESDQDLDRQDPASVHRLHSIDDLNDFVCKLLARNIVKPGSIYARHMASSMYDAMSPQLRRLCFESLKSLNDELDQDQHLLKMTIYGNLIQLLDGSLVTDSGVLVEYKHCLLQRLNDPEEFNHSVLAISWDVHKLSWDMNDLQQLDVVMSHPDNPEIGFDGETKAYIFDGVEEKLISSTYRDVMNFFKCSARWSSTGQLSIDTVIVPCVNRVWSFIEQNSCPPEYYVNDAESRDIDYLIGLVRHDDIEDVGYGFNQKLALLTFLWLDPACRASVAQFLTSSQEMKNRYIRGMLTNFKENFEDSHFELSALLCTACATTGLGSYRVSTGGQSQNKTPKSPLSKKQKP